jgi:pimeloyl-ACP methyl ester carboxylesterase
MSPAPEGAPARAPIDEGFFARARGVPQWITLRGADAANPPLLILSGPGVAFSAMAPFFAPWEADWTLAQWDQPGAGATFARNGELPLSLDRLADDAAAVAEIALARLGARKLAVLGISGGSIVGLKLAQARPDLVGACVGTGQIVHWARQQALGYELTLAGAKARGDAAAAAALENVGPPPHDDLQREMALSIQVNVATAAEAAAFASLSPDEAAALAAPPPGARYVAAGLVLPDLRARGYAAYLALRAEIAAFDAWRLGTRFEVPMIFLQGSEDLYTPTAEVARYAADISAPAVRVASLEGGGHSAVFMRQAFLAGLNEYVRPLVV